uniref:Uncharacterized protein n=1 Tax=Chromera velia CCMP2878 TaxID=1169474 RepID=A0A0G4FI01_9ALVE|eukprot:Cvel_17115.t1-p1 / transcript=Cvel_17115.t1 / gene=Cvel_17115 / organism=Chromera_velia_CCMP2878 / gene_product=hypothetical protein / transcript_product=hypothetical protein / location=Cvel_scaffold1349:46107-47693(+) / protein_length=278 / sequence_SO=supercontig / SO=protein_coding / is_pseudo=false
MVCRSTLFGIHLLLLNVGVVQSWTPSKRGDASMGEIPPSGGPPAPELSSLGAPPFAAQLLSRGEAGEVHQVHMGQENSSNPSKEKSGPSSQHSAFLQNRAGFAGALSSDSAGEEEEGDGEAGLSPSPSPSFAEEAEGESDAGTPGDNEASEGASDSMLVSEDQNPDSPPPSEAGEEEEEEDPTGIPSVDLEDEGEGEGGAGDETDDKYTIEGIGGTRSKESPFRKLAKTQRGKIKCSEGSYPHRHKFACVSMFDTIPDYSWPNLDMINRRIPGHSVSR